MTVTSAKIAVVSSTAENEDFRIVHLWDCAEIFLVRRRYLRRAERPLMPVHSNARSGDLTGSDCNQEASQPVFQIVFVGLVYTDGVRNHEGLR